MQEVDERLLEAHVRHLSSASSTTREVRTYCWGPLRDESNWSRLKMEEDSRPIAEGGQLPACSTRTVDC